MTHRRRRSPNRARRVDLVALAERHLYPGLPWRRYTRDQRCRTIDLAKAYLVERGQWPEGPGERDELRLMRGAA
jgi:hypothetical protein